MRCLIAPAATLVSASLLTALAGCGASHGGTRSKPPAVRSTIGLSSQAFANGSSIPARYTCDGEDVSPPLAWTSVPAAAHSLALLVEDPNAPGATFVHWTVYDLPPGSSGAGAGHPPSGSAQGQTSFGRVGYGGPCPPSGDPAHHYVFSIYALDDRPGLPPGATPGAVREAIAGHAIATGTLTGLYRRSLH